MCGFQGEAQHHPGIAFALLPEVPIEEEDLHVSPIGAKSIAEIGLTGAAAVVYHATGKRVSDLPITPDKLI